MQGLIDHVRPGARWQFDSKVAAVFTDMLQRSIPDHDTMRGLVFDIGSQFVRPNSDVVDLGCSHGDGLAPFIAQFGSANRFVGLDESLPMVEACSARNNFLENAGIVEIRRHDLRDGLPPVLPSLTLAILTLQFISIEYRQRVIADVFRLTRPGGAFIVVEKILGDDAATDRLLVDRYYALKRGHGYSPEDIDAKRKSLQGVLVPLTAKGNEDMLRAEGFRVQRFWQALNFAGWLAVKPEEAK